MKESESYENNTIRWGILGAGDVCEVKSGPAFQLAEHSELVAVMRRDSAKAEDFARRHGVGRWYDSVPDLLGDPEIDAVYIATPPRYHLEHTLAALAAGKDVYLEKPMAMNADECRQIIKAEEKSNNKYALAHYRRALPAFIRIRELIEDGTLGSVRLAELNFFLPASNSTLSRTATTTGGSIRPFPGAGFFMICLPICLTCSWSILESRLPMRGSP